MIFLTVGTQLPFPRLTAAMDQYAAEHEEPVIGQIGVETEERPHIDARSMISPNDFNDLFNRARVIVAHAGIGTILSAKRFCRPLIILPRRFDYGEHRNDHQVATAEALRHLPGIYIASDACDLPPLLECLSLVPATGESGPSHSTLVDGISKFIATVPTRNAPPR